MDLFPTRIQGLPLASSAKLKSLNRQLKKDIDSVMAIDESGWHWCKTNYVGGYTSYSSYAQLHRTNPPFEELARLIDPHVKKYAQKLHWDLQGQSLEMTTCWVNVMPNQVHHSLHLHPLSVVSGTYYLQVPKNASQLKFEDPRLAFMMSAPPRKKSAPRTEQTFFAIEPKVGQVWLWESWLRHEVTANRSLSQRISISFNYDWV